MYCQSAQTLIHHAPDAGVRTKNWLKTLLLLLCYYKKWGVKKKNGQGHKPVIPLRFSKSGNLEIEKWYATHFVDTKRIAVLKAQQPVENLD